MVPSSVVDPVQDPGIKGALFQEDCCQDLVLAGSNDSVFQFDSAVDTTLPLARQLFVAGNAGLRAPLARCTNSAEVLSKDDVSGLSLRARRGCQGDLENGIEDVRAGSSAVAGESRGIIGLREVSESDSSWHISCVTNSLNSSVGVDMSACARAACALPAAAAPRSCSTVARLSDAVVAHAHASPMHRARN